MEYSQLVKERYSCKNFDGRQVPMDQITRILEAGRLAPTAKNSQEQRIYVIQSEKNLQKIDELTPCRYGAKTAVVVAFDKNGAFTYPGQKYDSGIEDATIVATHLILAAKNEGVDSCWVNFFDPDKAHEALGLPENEEILTFIMLGYAAPGTGPLENHNKRKPLEETVTYM